MTANALVSLLGLLALWVMGIKLWKAYRISKFRQDLFNLRGDLFDLTESVPELSFDHPAYLSLRTTLDSVIRFAHRLNLIRFLATLYFCRKEVADNSALKDWESLSRTLPRSVLGPVSDIRLRMHLIVAGYVLCAPQFLLRGLMGGRRQKVSYVTVIPTSNRVRTQQLVATIRELEHQAVEDQAWESTRRREAALSVH